MYDWLYGKFTSVGSNKQHILYDKKDEDVLSVDDLDQITSAQKIYEFRFCFVDIFWYRDTLQWYRDSSSKSRSIFKSMGSSGQKFRYSEKLFPQQIMHTMYRHNMDNGSNESVERNYVYEDSDQFGSGNDSRYE